MSALFENFIDGTWCTSEHQVENINPSNTDDVIGAYAQATTEDLDRAISSAQAAFPNWSISGIMQRHLALSEIANKIIQNKDRLGILLAREEGKTKAEALGEVGRAAQIFDFFSGECLRMAGEIVPSVRPGVSVEVTREPVGVIGIITPWNFPIAIPAWKIAPALAYGNCVIFKPSNLAAGSAHALAEIIDEVGLPSGVFNLVMGGGRAIGQKILESDKIDAVTFTGSVEIGQLVARECAARMKKFQLEMGGKNPLVILDDADLETAIECALNGAFYSTGQRCTASSRIIVEQGIHDEFVQGLKARLEQLVVGDALDEQTQIGPLTDQAQLNKSLKYVQIGENEGARLVYGGQKVELDQPGFYFQPTLFADAEPNMRISREEIFGPVACVIKANDFEHAVELANDTDFGLSSGICTSSLAKATKFKRAAKAGMVMVNLPTAGVDFHVPFGGTKSSSYGPREQGKNAAEFYTTVKTSYIGV